MAQKRNMTISWTGELRRRGDGKGDMFLGLIVMLIGVVCLWQMGDQSLAGVRGLAKGVLGWAIVCSGGIFGLPGLYAFWIGLSNYRSELRQRRLSAQFDDEPWRSDYPWDPKGTTAGEFTETFKKSLGSLITSLVFAFLFIWLIRLAYDRWDYQSVMLFTMAIIMGALGVLMAYRTTKTFGRWIQHGSSRIEFAEFPFKIGETLRVRFKRAQPLRTKKLEASLICNYEYHTGGESGTFTRQVLYTDTKEFPMDGTKWYQPLDLELMFRIPVDFPPTRLGVSEPHYWELVVTADCSPFDFRAVFLVPIYPQEMNDRERRRYALKH